MYTYVYTYELITHNHIGMYSYIFTYGYTFPHKYRILDMKYSSFLAPYSSILLFPGHSLTTRVLIQGGCFLQVRPIVNHGINR